MVIKMPKVLSSLGSFRSNNDRQRRRKPRRWILLLGLMMIVAMISALAFAFTSKVSLRKSAKSLNMNPCDLFGGKVCPDALFSQTPPARPLTDEELASKVLAQDVLYKRPRRYSKPKIAFLFLTAGALPFEQVWEKFFEVCIYVVLLHT